MNGPAIAPSGGRQAGAVLAVTLLILLVLTVIGISSMSESGLQVFLARNEMLKQASFQRAESAARSGEDTWGSAVTTCQNDPANCAVDWDRLPAINETPPAQQSHAFWDAISGSGDTAYGEWVVEYLDRERLPGETNKWLYYYRISSRGQGANGKAETRLQTVWRKCVDRSMDPPGSC